MKRNILFGFCWLVILIFLSALPLSADQVTITYGYPGYGTWEKVVQDIKTQFEALHPDISLKIQVYPIGQEVVNIKAGTEPDVEMPHAGPSDLVSWRAQGPTYMNLQPLLDKTPDLKADLYPGHLQLYTYNGELLGLPYGAATRVYYWNKDIYKEVGLNPEKPPVTWKDLEAQSDKVTKKTASGSLTRVGYVPTWGNTFFPVYFWQTGGVFFKDVYGKQLAIFNGPEGVEALTWMVNMVNRYGTSKEMLRFSASIGMPGWGQTPYFATPQVSNPFLAKKTAMIGEGSWFLGQINQSTPDMKYGIAPIPYNKVPATWGALNAIVLSNRLANDPAKLAAAWEFVKFLYSPDGMVDMSLSEAATLPVTKSAAKDPRLIKNASIAPFLSSIGSITDLPNNPVSGVFWQTMGYDMVEQAMYFVKTPKQALDDAVDKVNKALSDFYAAQPSTSTK